MTTTAAPLPAGAKSADNWEVNGDAITRYFFGPWRGDRFHIGIMGEQDHSGTVISRTAYVGTELHDHDLDAADLREIAADCLAAADELDALSDAASTP